jgi:hypothetical protein
MYIDKILELTKLSEITLSIYRDVLAKRSSDLKNCPVGDFIRRKTTNTSSSALKYARNCYLLQEFIGNGDPKAIYRKRTNRQCKKMTKPCGNLLEMFFGLGL